MRFLLLLISLFVGLFAAASLYAAEGECLKCHAESSANRQLKASAHAGHLSCADCHGSDHQKIAQGESFVGADVCGRCHPQQLAEHRRSRHGMGLHAGWGCTRNMLERTMQECQFCHNPGDTRPLSTVQCARFLKQSPEMAQIGCNRCHMIEDSCASCHTNHLTEAKIVQDPAVCAKCHMGPDHPQWEAWKTSQHGTLYPLLGETEAPGCQLCHMPQGTHDVSGGLTAPPGGKPYQASKFAAQRQAMLELCRQCHAPSFAARELKRADAVRAQTLALVEEARAIIRNLDDHGWLDPSPRQRVPHPQRGQELVLDGAMLYEDISYIESLFFRLNKFAAAKTFKGAYHQNPDYTHWYGNAEVKLLLNDIKGEARRLQERAGQGGQNLPTRNSDPEQTLEVLQRQYQRGERDADAYRKAKQQVLEEILEMN